MGQTIAEKKANLHRGVSDLSPEMDRELLSLNKERRKLEGELAALYQDAWSLYDEEGNIEDAAVRDILSEAKEIKGALFDLDQEWQRSASASSDLEPYALWHQPETTLLQLVVDYGSRDYVYLVPPEVGQIKLSLSSDLPIPRSAWSEMLEWILRQNGVAIKQINPYLRQLSLIKEDLSSIKRITADREELHFLPPNERICFVLTPDIVDIKRAWLFLEKFSNPLSQQLQWQGRDIFIAATVSEVQELLRLYDFAIETGGDRAYQLIPLCKVSAKEMAKMLAVLLDDCPKKEDDCKPGNGLQVVEMEHLPRSLFLVGTSKEVKRAEEIIRTVEAQMCDSQDKEIYWYNTKHSDPEELAQVLAQVYDLMACNYKCSKNDDNGDNNGTCQTGCDSAVVPLGCAECLPLPDRYFPQDIYAAANMPINPSPVELGNNCKKPAPSKRQNFIVDNKSGSIVMVVEQNLLPKIKETIRKLDVPKKMVQIEVLMFEKRSEDQNNFGLTLLKMGSAASQTNKTSLVWNDLSFGPFNRGILDFFISRPETSGFAAFDLNYKFLISQSDMKINQAPSVLTVNQTEAKITIADEISLNMGAYNVGPTNCTPTLEKAFIRAQFGIKLSITPTIHSRDDRDLFFDDELDYITLNSKINFDTIHQKGNTTSSPM